MTEENKVELFDIVDEGYGERSDGFYVVLAGPFEIPVYRRCAGTGAAANHPLDIQNPETWKETYPAYVCLDLHNDEYAIIFEHNIRKLDVKGMYSYVPFDIATGKLRLIMGLLNLGSKDGKGAARYFGLDKENS